MSQLIRRYTLAALVVLGSLLSTCQAFSGISVVSRQTPKATTKGLNFFNTETALNAAATTSPTAASSQSSAPQVLEFQEPTTGVTVKLIGCMHYNPASIQLTEDTINELAKDDKLGSVIIESCDIRWNQTKQLPMVIQNLLQSEMKAACELTLEEYQRPVILGDQRINITVSSMKQGFQETLLDLVTPWNGGWGRLVTNVTQAREEALPLGESYLNLLAFFDPKLLLAAPVSLIKYPLSYFFKAPLRTSAFFMLLFLLEQRPSDAMTIVTLDQMTVGDLVGSLAVSVVEIALFARIFLKELLLERNKLLAQNILEQCKLYQQKSTTSSSTTPFWNLWNNKEGIEANGLTEILYVEDPNKLPKTKQGTENDKAVVAVLGMAHCNGIMKLLKEEKVYN